MQGIDVSHWQSGLSLNNVACDFIIVKITQGHTFVDECAADFIKQAQEKDIPWGVYHYINGSGAQREAQHFLQAANSYLGKGIICLDWEQTQNGQWGNENYLKQIVEAVVEGCNIAPFIYASKSSFPWEICSTYGCPRWVAQYRNNQPTGYVDNPWNESAYECEIRQYTENGRLASWDDALDLDKAYISATQWEAYAQPPTDAVNEFNALAAAFGVVKGEYGNGSTRHKALGSHYQEVQQIVNRFYREANNVLKGKYGNGAARREALGDDYQAVQWIVNNMLK